MLTILATVFAPSALAHAAYESSDPANGASVSSPPSRITAEFTEPVTEDSRLQVFDPCGAQVDNGDSLVAADRITVTVSADKQGTYSVQFGVISAVDSHPTNGTFTFTSTGGEPCPGEEPAEEEPAAEGGSGGGGGGGAQTSSSSGGSGNTAAGSSGGQEARAARARAEGSRPAARDQARGPERQRSDRSNADDPTSTESANEIAAGTASATETDVRKIWEGIPLLAFLIAMLVAAAIGGAGGLVYAGIMGPRR